ncbi:3-beta hydroxysteroid dehydrogenase/isomerase family [Musa troglodytarum]|uniref:3-beta hydroxysteroid dehydrogenase/isomerase family n=1 Tax=Musa troglodytarum TaxID=320322 RepID=A0A9E7FBD1_9LILI|nr:3-beta hydroxysteroid dehydrogenase/isomerase family [Musa troglodytarum]
MATAPSPSSSFKHKAPSLNLLRTFLLSCDSVATGLEFLLMAPAFVHRDRNTVCVMDASCRLGVSLVERLLRRGYAVHAATYGHGSGESSGSLRRLSGENRRLKLFHADPFDYQSIVDAMKGCAGLFYTFEPPQDQSYDEFLVEVEARSAHNVLEACAQVETMERAVFTSSVTAVVWKENRKAAAEFDEREWSEPNFCRKYKLWHALAKTLAEKTAWALAMDRGVDMVCVNAGLLLVAADLSVANPYLKGAAQMYEDGVLVTVDVDFLVDAHVAVYESPSAFGRYLCFNGAVCRPHDAVKLEQMLSHDAAQPASSDGLRATQQRIQNKKLNQVMVDFDAGRHVEE